MKGKRFTAGETEYVLRYDFNALCAIEDVTHRPLTSLQLTGASVVVVRAVLWAGLMKKKDMSLTKAGDVIQKWIDDGNDLGDLIKLVTEAMDDAGLLEKEEVEPDDGEGDGDEEDPDAEDEEPSEGN